jgi:outer membrane protein OmpA-like peptidoglycan-associated protein
MNRKSLVTTLAALSFLLISSFAFGQLTEQTAQSLNQSLFFGIAQKDIEALAAARDAGADVDVSLLEAGLDPERVFGVTASDVLKTDTDTATWAALTWAVYLQWQDGVRVLLKSGANVNAMDADGATPLHWAAWSGNYLITKMLLANGANPNALDHLDRSPLDWAVMTGQADIMRLLPQAQPEMDSDGDGVVDSMDQCPNTPKGAPVDARGCWIAAYASFFDFDKDVVKEKYKPYIKKAADILNANPGIVVEIAGHTDAIGSNSYNMDLGQRRAEAIRALLVEYGVAADRLKVKSYGESKPIASNKSAAGRAKNRRVEIHVWQPEAKQ